jgi:hypothetical protein
MNKGQRGNKEAKKPKKIRVPDTPLLRSEPVPAEPSGPRLKKR